MIEPSPISGLYAITLPGADLPAQVAAALRGGARVVQYRDKGDDAPRREAEAGALAALVRRAGATFIVNDDVELAATVGADGVHLGREDGALATARARLGAGALIGISCYDELSRAEAAFAAGADYVAFGSVFASPTKPDATRASFALLTAARRRLPLPIVAIGGITAGNAADAVRAGADAVAVASALFRAVDIEASARALAAAFSN